MYNIYPPPHFWPNYPYRRRRRRPESTDMDKYFEFQAYMEEKAKEWEEKTKKHEKKEEKKAKTFTFLEMFAVLMLCGPPVGLAYWLLIKSVVRAYGFN